MKAEMAELQTGMKQSIEDVVEGSKKPLLELTDNLKDVIKANYKKKIALMFH